MFGNEKGGTGKSTTAMHVVAKLLEQSRRVAVIDLDPRQKTLTRYIDNRRVYSERHQLGLTVPVLPGAGTPPSSADELDALIATLSADCDFVVIDCPGRNAEVAWAAHARADTLVTPVNDSFVDVDSLGHVDPDTFEVRKLSIYSEAVWESRKQRALSGRRGLDWIVIRNRVSPGRSRNKRRVDQALRQLEAKVAFRYVEGLSERTIFRELFPRGLTLLDFNAGPRQQTFSMSHVTARQELRNLFDQLKLL